MIDAIRDRVPCILTDFMLYLAKVKAAKNECLRKGEHYNAMKIIRKAAGWLLCLAVFVSLMPTLATAVEDCSANFNKDYTLTGNYGLDMVAIAEAQAKKTQVELGYTVDWCAYFVDDCARLAGVPQFPYRGYCEDLQLALLAWGGTWHSYADDYIPQKGDVIFFSLTSHDAQWSDHVGLVYKSGFNANGTVTTVEGNTTGTDANGNSSKSCVAIKNRPVEAFDGGLYIMGYLTINDGPNKDPDNHKVPVRTLQFNGSYMEGDDVVWLQMVLCKLGYTVDIDGIFGPGCKAKVTAFQKAQGLDADGICGPLTTQKMQEAWLTYKRNSCKIDTADWNIQLAQGEVRTVTVSLAGESIGSFGISCSDEAVCVASVKELSVKDGIAELELEAKSAGTAEISLQIVDKLGNRLLVKKLTVDVAEDLPVSCDINGDGQLDQEDLTVLLRHVAQIQTADDISCETMDVNDDNRVDAVDITILAGMIKQAESTKKN